MLTSRSGMNVLIVDDSRFLRLMNERALVKAGFDVLSAADGEEGLRLAIEHKPDLVVLDMMLPKLSGLDVLRVLRKDPGTASIPVMVLTSLPQCNAQKLVSEGATSLFRKIWAQFGPRIRVLRGCCTKNALQSQSGQLLKPPLLKTSQRALVRELTQSSCDRFYCPL